MTFTARAELDAHPGILGKRAAGRLGLVNHPAGLPRNARASRDGAKATIGTEQAFPRSGDGGAAERRNATPLCLRRFFRLLPLFPFFAFLPFFAFSLFAEFLLVRRAFAFGRYKASFPTWSRDDRIVEGCPSCRRVPLPMVDSQRENVFARHLDGRGHRGADSVGSGLCLYPVCNVS